MGFYVSDVSLGGTHRDVLKGRLVAVFEFRSRPCGLAVPVVEHARYIHILSISFQSQDERDLHLKRRRHWIGRPPLEQIVRRFDRFDGAIEMLEGIGRYLRYKA